MRSTLDGRIDLLDRDVLPRFLVVVAVVCQYLAVGLFVLPPA